MTSYPKLICGKINYFNYAIKNKNMLILQLKIISSNNEIKVQFLLKKQRGDESNSCLI